MTRTSNSVGNVGKRRCKKCKRPNKSKSRLHICLGFATLEQITDVLECSTRFGDFYKTHLMDDVLVTGEQINMFIYMQTSADIVHSKHNQWIPAPAEAFDRSVDMFWRQCKRFVSSITETLEAVKATHDPHSAKAASALTALSQLQVAPRH